MSETAWNLLEQLTSSPLKRALLESSFMLRHGFSFHLGNQRILWIKIYHSVLWSKSHSHFFLTQSLVQNKSSFSFPLIFGVQIFGKDSHEKLLFQACSVFAVWPAGILGNVLWDVLCHSWAPANATPGSEQLHPADVTRDVCTWLRQWGKASQRDWGQRKCEWQTPGQLPSAVILMCACEPGLNPTWTPRIFDKTV